MARTVAFDRRRIWTRRIAIAVAGGAVAVCAAYGVWFVGLDPFWAVSTVLAAGAVGALLVGLGFEEDAPWEPTARESPRGVRIAIAIIEKSLAACDRLARPTVVRRMRAFLIAERDDRLARSTVLRRMRALLVAELHHRGIDPATRSHDDAVVALLGPDALTILQPSDDNPVTTATIARCLDAVERLGTETQRSS